MFRFFNPFNISRYFSELTRTPSENWATENEIVLSSPAFVLRRLTESSGPPVLVVPPQAGHGPQIADYSEGHSVSATIANCGFTVYVIAFKTCTIDRKNETIEDLVLQVMEAIEFIDEPVYLVGLCMGGWLSSIVAALYPELIKKLIIAGAPINTSIDRENSSVCKAVEMYPKSFFENLVRCGNGMMLGDFILTGWMAPNWSNHFVKGPIDLYNAVMARDEKAIDRIRHFRDWYYKVQHLAKWYLYAVEHIFRSPDLWNGEVELFGKKVDIQGLKDTDVISLAGGKDDITPPNQAIALSSEENTYIIDGSGHIGVFNGGEKTQKKWRMIFEKIKIDDFNECN